MKNGYFETEMLLNLDISYIYKEQDREIDIEDLKIELGNGQNIDLFMYLPVKIIDKICEQIMENIEDEKKWI